MRALVLAEHDGHSLRGATLNAITAAANLGGEVDLLIAGHNARAIVKATTTIAGIDKVLVADDPIYAHPVAETVAALLIEHARDYEAILAAATTFGKNVLPRVAATLDVQQISEITGVVSPDTFIRPIYAGNALATVRSKDALKVITVRTTAFEPADNVTGRATISQIPAVNAPIDVQFVREELTILESPDLTSARIIISGGRGMQSGENFKMLEPIAEKLGAAIGASRAAVDAGFVSNDLQVGQTGKIVAPQLYIAVGISGAIQHLAGMSGSKVIVAINKDEDAPIFQVADYGLVGDLFKVLPELTASLSSLSSGA
ncbi:electron transfer flavoprotein subunit alpha/FixB family protein [Beijerinckia mobilis]|uniref:electron transfer flavoprotein subunit alpha/FixB family protein n=1 Tax=Beijerinckia mobilis TaxID=231434 RepID=UPI0005542E6D|nr:FAD-binding protein [Beijerinckia mobilis]